MELPNECKRADSRRHQILAAAARCFCEHGFHGASIAQISKVAGMSPGHIYHYFDNKDAIIGAIVAQDLEHRLALTGILREVAKTRSGLRAHVGEAITKQLDPHAAALKVEIIAEAARNPKVAEIVREADAIGRRGLAAVIREIRLRSGHTDDERIIDGIVELFSALFGGVILRSITNPALDAEAFISRLVCVIDATLHENKG
ncbi:MAG: TetR/AcrR family transcriptional regulator [Thauera sp.]|nr:TetR/AcrR family transcriptional regulator [Thauera sp.]